MKDYREMADNVLRRRDAYRMKKKKNRRAAASVLSCFCVMAVLGAGIRQSGILTEENPGQVRNVQPKDIGSTDTFDQTGRPAAEQETKQEVGQEEKQSAIKDFSADLNDENLAKAESSGTNNLSTSKSAGSEKTTDAPVSETETTKDMPVSDIPGDTGALTAYDKVWGGSYMDENGRWVVWLTENTPENRQTVFALNPALDEENTIFKQAAYSKAYLTDLMARISSAMGSDRLPFVTTAALREDKNCVEVTTISDDPASINQILAFDTADGDIADSGVETIYDSEGHVTITADGAIEIIYNPEGYVIMDLIKDPKEP